MTRLIFARREGFFNEIFKPISSMTDDDLLKKNDEINGSCPILPTKFKREPQTDYATVNQCILCWCRDIARELSIVFCSINENIMLTSWICGFLMFFYHLICEWNTGNVILFQMNRKYFPVIKLFNWPQLWISRDHLLITISWHDRNDAIIHPDYSDVHMPIACGNNLVSSNRIKLMLLISWFSFVWHFTSL